MKYDKVQDSKTKSILNVYDEKYRMLLNITVENFRSYNEPQTLSLIASDDDSDINAVKIGKFAVRKSAVIYGANASGKSNLIKAVITLCELLRNDVNPNLYQPFFNSQAPSKISIDFEINEQIYTYTVAYDAKMIHYEALLDCDDAIIYERKIRDKSKRAADNYSYEFKQESFLLNPEQLTVKDNIIKQLCLTTTEMRLFLRQCAENASEQPQLLRESILSIVIRDNSYMTQNVHVPGIDFQRANDYYESKNNADVLIDAFHSIGANFNKLETKTQDLRTQNGELRQLRTLHSYYERNGKEIEFNFFWNESDGTHKFYNYFAIINQVIDNNGIFIVDELDTYFHPLLVEELIRLIHNSQSRGQLIFATHNITLLNESMFERDQIHFAAKNDNQATELYSLDDFIDLTDKENLQAKYMAGKFGAIPYINFLHRINKRHG